jgi:hypothetical protein
MESMPTRSLCLLALVAAVTAASTPAATRTIGQRDAGREVAIRRCNVLAQRLYSEQEWEQKASDLYKACMRAAGFRP